MTNWFDEQLREEYRKLSISELKDQIVNTVMEQKNVYKEYESLSNAYGKDLADDKLPMQIYLSSERVIDINRQLRLLTDVYEDKIKKE